jgi:hypothetical protein
MVEVNASLAPRPVRRVCLSPLRLVAQDIGFSVREQGFDSPRGYLKPAFRGLFSCANLAQVTHLRQLTTIIDGVVLGDGNLEAGCVASGFDCSLADAVG